MKEPALPAEMHSVTNTPRATKNRFALAALPRGAEEGRYAPPVGTQTPDRQKSLQHKGTHELLAGGFSAAVTLGKGKETLAAENYIQP